MRRPLITLLLVCAGITAAVVLRTDRGARIAGLGRSSSGALRVVVLGDSVAHGAGDEQRLGLQGWLDRELRARSSIISATLNLGIDGARTANVARALREPAVREAVGQADVIVLSVGGNDLYGDSWARLLSTVWPWYQRERTLIRVEGVVAAIQQLNPSARIYLLGLYNPYRGSSVAASLSWIDTQVNLWDGGLIQEFASTPGVTVIRITDLLVRDERISPIDHFHPGALGYAAIARRLADAF
jgi:lysophospholipase L1-like esterase